MVSLISWLLWVIVCGLLGHAAASDYALWTASDLVLGMRAGVQTAIDLFFVLVVLKLRADLEHRHG